MVDKNIEVPGFPRETADLTAEEAAEAGYADAVLRNITEVWNIWAGDQLMLQRWSLTTKPELPVFNAL